MTARSKLQAAFFHLYSLFHSTQGKEPPPMIKIECLPNEPILYAVLSGQVTPDDVCALYRESARLADEIGGTVYRISDVSSIEVSFSDLVDIMSRAAQKQPGSPADPRMVGVMFGASESAYMYSDGMRQDHYGNRKVPVVKTYDEAMAYIRQQMNAVKQD
jgi:hypothetical protein